MSIIKDYILSFWAVFTTMAPWLLFGFFVAGLVGFLSLKDKTSPETSRESI